LRVVLLSFFGNLMIWTQSRLDVRGPISKYAGERRTQNASSHHNFQIRFRPALKSNIHLPKH
jgi:hypothetical protein